MPSTPTTRNRLNLQGSGDNVGSWGTVLNAQVLNLLDESLDGVTTLTLTADVTLSSQNYVADQSRRRILKLVGTPAASVTITLPSVEKFYLVHNGTTLAHTVKAGGTGVLVQANSLIYVYCDGTTVYSPAVGLTAPVGTVADFAGTAIPTGWLLCYGQAVLRTTYTALFQAIGTAFGTGDGSTTFNIPDGRGRFRVGHDTMGGTNANRLAGIVPNLVGASGGHALLHTHAHATTASATTNVALGSLNAFGAASVTYLDWSVPITTVGVTAGGTSILAPASAGADTTRTVFSQPVTVTLGGAPTAVTSIVMNNTNAGVGNAQNVPPCSVFNTIIYSGV